MKMIQQVVVGLLLTLTTLPLSNSAVAGSNQPQQGDPTDSHSPAPREAPPSPPGNLPGRLVVHPANPGYFQDTATGKAVFLHGFDHFRALQEYGNNGVAPLDFEAFVTQLGRDRVRRSTGLA